MLLQGALDAGISWLHLAEMEARQTGITLTAMMGRGVLLALLLASAWMCLVAAVVMSLIQLGANASLALLIAGGLNLLLGYGVLRSFAECEKRLGWPATLRSLRHPSGDLPAPDQHTATRPDGAGQAAHAR
jgi:hypothetical protein